MTKQKFGRLMGLLAVLSAAGCGSGGVQPNSWIDIEEIKQLQDTPSQAIYLYDAGPAIADFGGRAGAKGRCAFSLPLSLQQAGYNQVEAFLSTGKDDELHNLLIPTDREIRSITDVVLANTWNDLLNNDLFTDLQTAEVTTAATFWSGSIQGGSVNPLANCDGFTDVVSAGQVGVTHSVSEWIAGFGLDSCDEAHNILCLAY